MQNKIIPSLSCNTKNNSSTSFKGTKKNVLKAIEQMPDTYSKIPVSALSALAGIGLILPKINRDSASSQRMTPENQAIINRLNPIKGRIIQAKTKEEVICICNDIHLSTEESELIRQVANFKMISLEIEAAKNMCELTTLARKLSSLNKVSDEVVELLNKRANELTKCKSGIAQAEKTVSTMRQVADFTTLEEAQRYFDAVGIKAIFGSGAKTHLADLNKIKDDLIMLGKNGVALSKPKSVVVSDWHNASELRQICNRLGLSEEEFYGLHVDGTKWGTNGYWGTVSQSSDGLCNVLINSSFSGNYGHFKHEMGHFHQDHLESSFWHSKGLSGESFIKKQMEILGLEDVVLKQDFLDGMQRFTPNLFHYKCVNNDSGIIAIGTKQYGYLRLNIKKVIDRMAQESHVYAPEISYENIAEIFQGLNDGKTYSDFVMLAYDLMGGGRVPNRIIKGMKYDDYIESLYNNSELVRELRRSIAVIN